METYLPSTTVCAIAPSRILNIPKNQLLKKMQQDLEFAARLYRAIAILLSTRLQQMMSQLGRSTVILSKPQLREALIVFALHDSDIEWLVAAGLQEIAANKHCPATWMWEGDL